MNTLQYEVTVEANNNGVAYLEAGDFHKALESFSVALKHTMGDLDPNRSAGIDDLSAHSDNHGAPSERQESMAPPASTRPVARVTTSETKSASAPFAYARGINLIPYASAYSLNDLINTTVVSSIIIFNLSIIYHLKGLEGRSMGRTRLHKAKSLYQKSHRLLADAGVPLGSTGNPVVDMLSMALYNNLAHVSYELQGYDESKAFFQNLIRFALTVLPSKYGDPQVGLLLDQQKSNFLLNAIILQAPKLAAAA
jgi:tetratricopeptide (TPR) repeat protein